MKATVERLRVQIVLGFVMAVIIPALVGSRLDTRLLSNGNILNSLIACSFALFAGIALFRQFRNFPGVRAYEYVLPSFSTAYGVVVAFMLVSRLDYVVSVLLLSVTLSIMTFFILCYISLRQSTYVFHVVPCGDVAKLESIRNVDWVILNEPILPASTGSGLVVDLRADISDEWERLLADAALEGIPVFHLKQLLESITGQLEIEHISENSLGSLNPNDGYGKVKQVADVIMAVVMLPLLLPLLSAIAIAIRLDSRGPVLFCQQRMGYRGRPFKVFKFRTMRSAQSHAEGEEARIRAITHSDDDRITRIGRLLRRARLDEIPQILNVLRGEMSWIGPRPEAISLSNWYRRELPFYSYRHVVKPGITGWAQVNQGHVAEISDVQNKLCYDFYYIKYLSAWLDALIALRTIRTVITGSGAK